MQRRDSFMKNVFIVLCISIMPLICGCNTLTIPSPDEIIKKLESAMGKALQDKEVQDRLRKIEIVVDFMNSEETQEWVNRDYKKWSDVISVVDKGKVGAK